MEQAAREAFAKWRGSADRVVIARAPGRVNLVGDHTDYNDGLVLPMILDRAVYVAARFSLDGAHHFWSENYREGVTYSPGQWPGVRPGHWASYIAGMIQELPPPGPIELLVMGDVPLGAGLSSSAALEMATGLALEALRGKSVPPLELAQIGQRVEHRYAGVKCGIMDQIVSRVGRTGHALFLDCHTLKWEHIPIQSEDIQFLVIDSRVRRQLATSKYNERRAECQKALEFMQASDAAITSLRYAGAHHVKEIKESVLQRRIRHVISENNRVEAACSTVIHSDWGTLGRIFSLSHESLQGDYEVSCEEMDFLAAHAELFPGVFGARMMGGGFGGCTINLARAGEGPAIAASVTAAYEDKYEQKPVAHIIGPGLEARRSYD
ncbi:MAG: galactokinase [Rhodothermaceae bacterium]|nr:galactokinase [Rhodothermaceae bacterium]MYD20078.1 galactokinase [Rhodothermaceae bacterium]MYD56119.1 galactokinase [Rhodothermaceae bacterium]MYI43337.1 galactokinase [Rhodothermaceae bacterium]MYJ56789.1 galactokinase [Rhodothermaceae bacterium]